MHREETVILPADAPGIVRAAAFLRAGRLVAFPTETVYGLGADARNPQAVAGIFAAKGRPRFNPLIVHVADVAAARAIAVFDARAERLAAAFWPGALTLVLPLRAGAGIADLVTAGSGSVAVRVPDHPVAQALLAAFGGPLAAPSANPSGKMSPTTAAHVLGGLAGRIAAVVDGGPCPVGLESTILGLTGPEARLLRPGGLPAEIIEAALGAPLALLAPDAALGAAPGAALEAPGMLASHYAPDAALRLDAEAPRAGEVWLGFGPGAAAADINLSPSGDMADAAARLFAALREADALARARGVATVAVSPVPRHGLGRAINDRLARAAAPRP